MRIRRAHHSIKAYNKKIYIYIYIYVCVCVKDDWTMRGKTSASSPSTSPTFFHWMTRNFIGHRRSQLLRCCSLALDRSLAFRTLRHVPHSLKVFFYFFFILFIHLLNHFWFLLSSKYFLVLPGWGGAGILKSVWRIPQSFKFMLEISFYDFLY